MFTDLGAECELALQSLSAITAVFYVHAIGYRRNDSTLVLSTVRVERFCVVMMGTTNILEIYKAL